MKMILFRFIAIVFVAGSLTGLAQNATLLTAITNPTPASSDSFGYTVAGVGGDRVLTGAPSDSSAGIQAGAAYLIGDNGALLTIFTNSSPSNYAGFGRAVATVGSDRVLIGEPLNDIGTIDAGAAFLFSINGTLLTTIPNPDPQSNDGFGASVAALGNDLVIIGSQNSGISGAFWGGAAYLFNVDGGLLQCIS